jgi:hypothetical protein
MPNRLIHETSPYLRQHAQNPVDWYPWGDEAFAKARDEDKPIFLSIGYSACHWCHVMERESFEDEQTAKLLNESFVSIKVDREERPDVDSIYMQAVQMMTGHGGWPMSVFLTADGAPFYGGTYFPPADRHGLPSFRRLLAHLVELWQTKRDDVKSASHELRLAIASSTQVASAPQAVTLEGLDEAASGIAASFDPQWGGFGGAPKFPPSMALDFLMQVARRRGDEHLRRVVLTTLDRMAAGGIYDQVGGGFHRYSTDARWLAPHFEKMLYDNALLARLYIRAWQWTHEPRYARVARETLGFVQREMTSPEGGFYSTLDADSEGVEGKFYVWQLDELLRVLGPENGRIAAAAFDVTQQGNWEAANILNLPRDLADVARELSLAPEELGTILNEARGTLHGEREKRVRPARDEKILAGWNGWMLAAFSEAAIAFGSSAFAETAARNADFLLERMIAGDRLRRSWMDGEARVDAVLEDYAGVSWGLIAAFEATQEMRYLTAAGDLLQRVADRFSDRDGGPFWDTPSDGETLIARPRDLFDNATPSGNSLAVASLFRIAAYFDDAASAALAGRVLESLWPFARRLPSAFGFLLAEAAEWKAGRPKEIAITGPSGDLRVQTLLQVVGETFLPQRLLVRSPVSDLPLMEGKPQDRVAAWVCENYACKAPVEDPEELRELLEG